MNNLLLNAIKYTDIGGSITIRSSANVREAEIELSRDRAQIARERIQLERLREEIRTEQERTGRDEELQNRQAACQRLREPEPR